VLKESGGRIKSTSSEKPKSCERTSKLEACKTTQGLHEAAHVCNREITDEKGDGCRAGCIADLHGDDRKRLEGCL
jgi:hypothetical protein